MPNVIVVDDNEELRAMLARLVSADGHVVREAADGLAAMKLMREQVADAVVCDVYMPEMDGLEILSRLQREFPAVGVVIVSGGGSIGTTDLLAIAASLGARATLRKPFDHSDFRAALAKALE